MVIKNAWNKISIFSWLLRSVLLCYGFFTPIDTQPPSPLPQPPHHAKYTYKWNMCVSLVWMISKISVVCSYLCIQMCFNGMPFMIQIVEEMIEMCMPLCVCDLNGKTMRSIIFLFDLNGWWKRSWRVFEGFGYPLCKCLSLSFLYVRALSHKT